MPARSIVRFVENHDDVPTLPIEHGARAPTAWTCSSSPRRTVTQVRLVAALDNLGKGASGAAVQNLNLLCGLNETAGLIL
jgi:N-acetyl-gamma-glutamyl-phosphate reductase